MTDSGTARTLDELITLYELEPNLREVITEGRSDAAVVLWFLRQKGIDTAVYSVADRVNVPAAEIKERGLNAGRKGSIIAAALAVAAKSESAAERVTFIYDLDDDLIAVRPTFEAECLLHTDYTSMEMYCWSVSAIDKLLKLSLRASEDVQAAAVLDAVTEGLLELAFARLVLSEITRPVAMVKTIERKMSVASGRLTVNVSSLLGDSLNSAGGGRSRVVTLETLVESVSLRLAEWTGDPRLVVRGHDFTRVLCFYLKTLYPSLFKEDRSAYKAAEVVRELDGHLP